MKEIEKYIESYFEIGRKDLTPIADLFKKSTLKKNDYFLRENQSVNKISFVRPGYLRVHALSYTVKRRLLNGSLMKVCL